MVDVARTFLDESRRLLVSDYLPKIERCLEELSDDDVWWRPNEASNSIGNLMLHLNGNVRQWVIGGVGLRPVERNRQQEFEARTHLSRQELLSQLKATLHEAGDVISRVDSDSLLATRHIQHYDVTLFEAIYHVVEHFGMHTGQIITLTKIRTAKNLELWRPSETWPP